MSSSDARIEKSLQYCILKSKDGITIWETMHKLHSQGHTPKVLSSGAADGGYQKRNVDLGLVQDNFLKPHHLNH